jgi:hypothetical protein
MVIAVTILVSIMMLALVTIEANYTCKEILIAAQMITAIAINQITVVTELIVLAYPTLLA